MKKILTKNKSTILSLLLLCFSFLMSTAFILNDSMNSTSLRGDKEDKAILRDITGFVNLKNKKHNDVKSIDYNNQLDALHSNDMTMSSNFDCPEDIVINADVFSCTASGELPIPANIQGLCGGNEFYAETLQGGMLTITGSIETNDLSVFAQNFVPGAHLVNYEVEDSCDNVFACEFEVVVPPIIPSINLNQNTVVTLSSSSVNGEATTIIYVDSLISMLFNPCSLVKLEIRKDIDLCGVFGNSTFNADGDPNDGDPDPNSTNYDPDNGESIKFCCEDAFSALYDINEDGINDTGYMKVWVRVWGDTNLDSLPGNEGDTYTDQWTFVKVEEKFPPEIICPQDITMLCDEAYMDIGVSGSAIAYSVCEEVGVEYTDITIDLNACNEGYIIRRWNVQGQSDIFCDQIITLEGLDEPINVDFSQMEDFTSENCVEIEDFGEPTWDAGSCGALEYTIDTDTLFFEDGACFQFINSVTVINSCIYKPDDPFWEGEGIWEHVQIVKVFEETKPMIANCQDRIFAINDNSDSDNDGITCEAKITLQNLAMDEGSIDCTSPLLNWQVAIDLYGDGTDDLEYSSFLPSSDNEFDDTNNNGIPDIYLSPTNSEEAITIQLPDIVGSISNHRASWKVIDGCNNVSTCSVDFLIEDQTSPTATCQDSITVGLAPIYGESILWADNYILDVVDNCTPTENISYTFSDIPPQADPSFDLERRSSNFVLNISHISNGFVQLPIYIWDERGNFTNCETVFIIDPNLVLSTENSIELNENTLYQNQPNPFRLNTTISFSLSEETQVKLTFINATSLEVLEIEIEGKTGLNSYVIERDLLFGQGLYYYTMTTKQFSETKKMVLIL